MLARENDKEIRLLLEEYILDLQLEGDEFEKNKYLAPAEPIPSRDKEIMSSESDSTDLMQNKAKIEGEEHKNENDSIIDG